MTSDADRDILRLKRCPGCGYDLVGLPAAHVCPECGYTYNEQEFIVPGWSSRAGKWGHWLVLGAVSAAVILSIFLAAPMRVPLVASAVVLALLWGSIARLVKGTINASDFDLYMNKDGYCELLASGTSAFHPWREWESVRLRRACMRRRRWRLRLKPARSSGSPFASFVYEIDCTKRQAALLRSEINRRIREAHGIEDSQ